MSEFLTGLCPNCGTKLTYEQKDKTVTCFACDCSINVSDLSGNNHSVAAATMASHATFVGFDNPESGVVFLENFFDTYDWAPYQHSSELLIPEIAEVIGNNKMKNGAVAETWYLDFMGLYVPVFKKFEALDILSSEIRESFDPTKPDQTQILQTFDQYREISRVLLKEKATIFKALNSAIGLAERFSLDDEKLSQMKSGITILEQAYTKIATRQYTDSDGVTSTVPVAQIEKHPAYVAAKEAYAKRTKGKYLAIGIDAEDNYNQAVAAYNAGDTALALNYFERIRGYSDSAIYIRKINQYFNFHGEVFRFAGKHFVYKRENLTADALNIKQDAQKAKASLSNMTQMAATALSLYEVVNGVPEKIPTIRGIDQIITCYGSKLFYFKSNQGIAYYDLLKKAETIVDFGTSDQYCNANGEYNMFVASGAPIFAVKKLYKEEEQSGCFSKKKPAVERINPYTIVLVNMAERTATTVVKELLDVKLAKDDKVFFTHAYKVAGNAPEGGCLSAKVEQKIKTRLMVCDIASGIVTKVLNEDCEIHRVYNNSIIYTLWVPNDFNEELHVYNMDTEEDVVIEKNIYEFYDLIDGKLYYTVGNGEFRPLVRNNFEGTKREQIMQNIKKILFTLGEWFYVTKGYGCNVGIMKIRTDGKVSLPLCNSFNEFVNLDGNYIYYTDVFENLRVVRIDGKENRIIAEEVSTIFPAYDGLYYCRLEQVGDNAKGLSLYKMDKNGRNVRKIVFNVDKVKHDPLTNTIYYSQVENTRFRVYTQGKKNKAFYMFFKLTKYYQFTKASADEEATDPELFLTLGLPEQEKNGCGCLAKFKKDLVYEKAPIVHSYKNRGMSDAQIMAGEGNAPVAANLPKWGGKLPQGNKVATALGSTGKGSKFGIIYTIFSFYALINSIISIGTIANSFYDAIVPAIPALLWAIASTFLALLGFGVFKRKLALKNKFPAVLYLLSAIASFVGFIIGLAMSF